MMMILSDHQLHDPWGQHPCGPQSQRNHYDLVDHLEKSYARIRLALIILQGQREFLAPLFGWNWKTRGWNIPREFQEMIGRIQCSAHMRQVQNSTPISVKVNVQDPKHISIWYFTAIAARDLCGRSVYICLQSDSGLGGSLGKSLHNTANLKRRACISSADLVRSKKKGASADVDSAMLNRLHWILLTLHAFLNW